MPELFAAAFAAAIPSSRRDPSLAHTSEQLDRVEAAAAAFAALGQPLPRGRPMSARDEGALELLAELLREQGGLIADARCPRRRRERRAGPARTLLPLGRGARARPDGCLPARAPRGRRAPEYELLVETIYEGYFCWLRRPM